MARRQRPVSVHPEDPLNSYAAPTFRGWIITAVVIIVVFAGLWLAYGAALNNPDLRRELDGREQVQGAPLPDQPEPGGQ